MFHKPDNFWPDSLGNMSFNGTKVQDFNKKDIKGIVEYWLNDYKTQLKNLKFFAFGGSVELFYRYITYGQVMRNKKECQNDLAKAVTRFLNQKSSDAINQERLLKNIMATCKVYGIRENPLDSWFGSDKEVQNVILRKINEFHLIDKKENLQLYGHLFNPKELPQK